MIASDTQITDPRTSSRRIGVFDVVRGLALISMVLFHLCYDLVYLKGFELPWFSGVIREVWRCSISWTFLFVAGCMCCLSRNNLKRAGVYALFALGIFVVTSLAGVDSAINFGIIYAMAVCTFVYWCLSKIGLEPKGFVCGVILFVVFLFLLDLPHGTVGLRGLFAIEVPRAPYDVGILAWAGFPGPGFSSADYYPLLPYLFMFLCGSAFGHTWVNQGYPEWARSFVLQPFTWLGQHSLIVYAVHQPLILAVLSLI